MLSATAVAARTGPRKAARLAVPSTSSKQLLFGQPHATRGYSISRRTQLTGTSVAIKNSLYKTPARTAGNNFSVQQRHGYATTTNPNPPLGKKNASNDAPSRIALIGARGYTGQALIDLLNNHPKMDLRYISSRELAGQELPGYTKRKIIYEDLSPEDIAQLDKDNKVDCWVMALPNGVSRPYIEALDQVAQSSDHKSVIVDLSADHRFNDAWTYGLPELTKRSDICKSRRISNPGCYAIGAQLAIAPLLEHLEGQAVVFGVSGYSGAGTKPSPRNDVKLLTENLMPYSLTGHMHEKEITHNLGASVAFMPHVTSWFRGISLTVSIPLKKEMNSRDVRQLYQDHFAGEELVKVVGEAPLVRDISDKHHCELGGFAMDKAGKRVVV